MFPSLCTFFHINQAHTALERRPFATKNDGNESGTVFRRSKAMLAVERFYVIAKRALKFFSVDTSFRVLLVLLRPMNPSVTTRTSLHHQQNALCRQCKTISVPRPFQRWFGSSFSRIASFSRNFLLHRFYIFTLSCFIQIPMETPVSILWSYGFSRTNWNTISRAVSYKLCLFSTAGTKKALSQLIRQTTTKRAEDANVLLLISSVVWSTNLRRESLYIYG